MSERSILSRLVTSAKGEPENAGVPAAQQFPKGYAGGQLPGAYGTNFAQFRPQYSVPGQQVRDSYIFIHAMRMKIQWMWDTFKSFCIPQTVNSIDN